MSCREGVDQERVDEEQEGIEEGGSGGLLSFYIATGVFFSGLDMIPAHLIFIKSADGVAWILTPATHDKPIQLSLGLYNKIS